MTKLYIAHRLRALTETAPPCPAYVRPARDTHPYCLQCGGEEWPHIARAAADLLEGERRDVIQDQSEQRVRDHLDRVAASQAIDIVNRQGVALSDGAIIVFFPHQRMTPDAALVHAAWLVAVAGVDASISFERILARVLGT